MSTASMSVIFALLTVVALIGAAAMSPIGARVGALRSGRVLVARNRWLMAWLVALVATSGSLYYSEVADFIPCELCWYQRIFMYPLAVILLVAAFRRERAVRWYVLPMVTIGAGISTYHYLLQRFPSWSSGACDIEAPCTLTWVWEFGFVSIPMMALAGFLFIGSLMLFGDRST